jgi:IMP dehydrogenase
LKIKKCIAFDDVLLVPRYSDISTRQNISLESKLEKNINFSIPIISSPMDTVTEESMACAMGDEGGLGIIHRYNTIDRQSTMVEIASRSKNRHVGAAIGVSGDYIERASELYKSGARIICVDIAHGHHSLMRHSLETLKNTFGTTMHIMAGNVATLEAFNDLSDWGADSVRVGIGGGSICSTRIQTGHGVPTLQSIIDCSYSDRDTKLVADGGIKNSGDIVKALAAGADFVMIGSLLSGTEESPGDKISRDGHVFKEYRGMASSRAQINWRGRVASQEGVSALVPYKGPVKSVIKSLEAGIRSGLSYSGCRSINELQNYAEMIQQTSSGISESNTHVFSRGIKL